MPWLKEFKKHEATCGGRMYWKTPIGGQGVVWTRCHTCGLKIAVPIGEAHLLQKALAEQQCSGGGE